MHNGILLCHKEGGNPVICRKTIGTEVIMLSRVSQTQKDKYYMFFFFICGNKQKNDDIKVEEEPLDKG